MASARVKCSSICLFTVIGGGSPAIVIAECGHSFHFCCITRHHATMLCPTCGRKWNTLPSTPNPTPQINPNPIVIYPQEPQFFSDDDPLLPNTTGNSHHPQIILKSHTEYPSLPASSSSSSFAVLIRAIAPPASSHRAPIDLVLVLDVSTSMGRVKKLSLLKQAVTLVIENLGLHDRLSIVTFSNTARRLYPLRSMSGGKQEAITIVNSLVVQPGTDILAGLLKGIRVLHERRERNPVASVLLLSDGQHWPLRQQIVRRGDNNNNNNDNDTASIISAAGAGVDGTGASVHTFGFGVNHDATLLHGLANATGGTFSFIESTEIISEAFARCVGGLLSVVAKDLIISLGTVSNGVRIVRIPAVSSQVRSGGKEGVIKIDGMLYADEEKQFLVYLRVPRVRGLDSYNQEEIIITKLLDPSCEYKEPNSTAALQQDVITLVEGETVKIERPRGVLTYPLWPDSLVVREKNRLDMVDDIGQAQSLADSGDFMAAQSLLEKRAVLLNSAAGNDQNNDRYTSFLGEIAEIKKRMVSKETYTKTGRAYTLSWLNAQGLQRASTRGNAETEGSCYDTPGMLALVKKCKEEIPDDDMLVKKCKVEKGSDIPSIAKKCKIEKN